MMTIKKEITVEIDITPTKLAELFWDMDDAQQAFFFNRLGEIKRDIGPYRFAFQLTSIQNHKNLNRSGKASIRTIGEHFSLKVVA